MVETISSCAFSVFEKHRSCSHLVIATQTSVLPKTRGIFLMKKLHDLVTRHFSLFEHRFSGISVNGVKATTSNCRSKVGGRRGTVAGPFSTSPFRTVLAPFSAHGSPISRRSLSRLYASRGPSQVLTILSVPLPRVSGIAPII